MGAGGCQRRMGCQDSGCRRRGVQEWVYRLGVPSREDTVLGGRGPALGGCRAVLGCNWEAQRCGSNVQGCRAGGKGAVPGTEAQHRGSTGRGAMERRAGPAPLAPPDGADAANISGAAGGGGLTVVWLAPCRLVA